MYHIVFTLLSTYREYCHACCAYRELAVEFLYDYYYRRKSEGKKKQEEAVESSTLKTVLKMVPGKSRCVKVCRVYYTYLAKKK